MKSLITILITAVITTLTLTLPGLLYLRGLPLGWSLALLAAFAAVAGLGYQLGRRH